MTNVRAIWLILMVIYPLFLAAQHNTLTQIIRGKVLDKHTQMPLPGATVLLLNTHPPKGTTTNAQGTFRLENIPVGRVSVRVSFVGYERVTLRNLLLKSGKELILNIELEENVQELEKVVFWFN